MLDREKRQMLAQGEPRKGTEFLVAWFSTENSINMRSDLDLV